MERSNVGVVESKSASAASLAVAGIPPAMAISTPGSFRVPPTIKTENASNENNDGMGDMERAIYYQFGLEKLSNGVDPFLFMESCAAKSVTSAAIGGGMGAAMGLLLGSYQSIAPPMSVPGVPDPPKIPARWQLRESYHSTARRMRRWGRNFAMVTAVFAGVECVVEKYRARHDVVNGVTAGCITGAALAAKQGPAAMCFGCAGFAAFSAVIDQVMGH